MKRILLIIILAASALISKAQTVSAMADSAFAHQKYQDAYTYYMRIIDKEPKNIKVLRRLGFCWMQFTDSNAEYNAKSYFLKALEVDPNDSASNYYLGLLLLENAKNWKTKEDEAIKNKANFKAKAALYLKKAVNYGSEDAKIAIKDLNGI